MATILALIFPLGISAHPLGNFTISHFSRIEISTDRLKIHYVVDMAEIPTFQELQAIHVGGERSPSSAEFDRYVEGKATQYAEGLFLTIEGTRVPLQVVNKKVQTIEGGGGLQTLRVECDFTGTIPAGAGPTSHLHFEDLNHKERLGWREMVVVAGSGISIFDSTAFGTAVTNELKAYPLDMLTAPLDERVADLAFTQGPLPPGSTALGTREGRPVEQSRDRLAELIAVPEIT
ncbi:MAG: hypothetical protein ACR2HX_20970, partial [Pyrinomonadaceae bacterium]